MDYYHQKHTKMQNLNSYFIEHNLFDESKLIDHCDRNLVRISKSEKYPHLRILHYLEEAHREKTWTNFCRRCRGVIVDLKNKKILAYPFDKFFNMDEMPETSYSNLKDKTDFEVSEKLDGSMGILYHDKEANEYRVATKGSLDSEQGQWGTEFLRYHPQLSILKIADELTLIFEIVSYKYRIVIDYKKKGYEEGLYLVGVRHLKSEKMFSYDEVKALAKQLELKHLNVYKFSTLDSVIDSCKEMDYNTEGYVLNYDGTRVKIKSMEYLKVHRFLSRLSGKNLLEALIVGEEKDVVELAPEEYINEIRKTVQSYKDKALKDIEYLCIEFAKAPQTSRKDFALWVQATVNQDIRSFMFCMYDGKVIDLKHMYKHYLKTKQWDDSFDNFMCSKFTKEEVIENVH